ncbi:MULTISPECIES: rhomboid family intramembrane serine protease [Halostella]|uniref:rhomboid family intramembrane serine protease n=2 Tax=Halobacteriales TaxID=2235 RepID=UPI001081ABBA|nr:MULTISPECIES: rhomboid family intramembrane serine protease [Halostella]
MRTPLADSPTVDTLLIFAAVFLAQQLMGLLIPYAVGLFALAPPLSVRPWTIVTSVYAHSDVSHLLANSITLLFVGIPVERSTTPFRFHVFFIATGATAGIVQVLLKSLIAEPIPVLGASGAVFALLGYVLTGNRLASGFFSRFDLSPPVQLLGFAVLAAVVTVATGAPDVALIAHFTGFLLGLVAGRIGVLDASPRASVRPENTTYK